MSCKSREILSFLDTLKSTSCSRMACETYSVGVVVDRAVVRFAQARDLIVRCAENINELTCSDVNNLIKISDYVDEMDMTLAEVCKLHKARDVYRRLRSSGPLLLYDTILKHHWGRS